MRILQVSKLNSLINSDIQSFINKSEEMYADEINAISDKIIEQHIEKPITLVSGPSGSAKTTTALRIKEKLAQKGYSSHVISMDNYFLPLNTEDLSKIDLEAPARMDLELIAEHLEGFFGGTPVELPVFDFATQSRTVGKTLCRQPDEIIILEGIHALNPEVTGSIYERSNGVYVSVRTRLELDGQLLHPSKIRLMRRLMRDNLFRGREITDIITAYKSVERGEELYIMPFKERASYDIDTFIAYEAAVYKALLLPQLLKVPHSYENYELIDDMILFLENLNSVPLDSIPLTSIVREFIGGSGFTY